jgi:hypothetical protein
MYYMFQPQKQNNIKKTQSMLKSYFIYNDILFLNLIFSYFLFVFSDLKWYGYVKLKSTLIIWVPKVKEQHKNAMKKINELNLKKWIKLVTKMNVAYFW